MIISEFQFREPQSNINFDQEIWNANHNEEQMLM